MTQTEKKMKNYVNAVERRLKNVQETPQAKPAQRRKPKPAARNYFDEW